MCADKVIATLTIGQAPRTDIIREIGTYLPTEYVNHFGLLDGLDDAYINQQFSPQPGEMNGKQIQLGADSVEQGLQQKIEHIEAQGYQLLLLLCIGLFNCLKVSTMLLLAPDRILPALLNAMMPGERLGVIVPITNQIIEQNEKWQRFLTSPCFAVANPYQNSEQQLISAGLRLKQYC